MTTIDDDILMAYADGELDGADADTVRRAVDADPALAAKVERHRALRRAVRDALAPALDEPVPERLRALLQAPAPGATNASCASDELAAARARRARPTAFPLRWVAVAAALVLGLALGPLFVPKPAHDFRELADGTVVADGALADALQSRLASDGGDPAIGLSFRDGDGRWCRTFTRDAVAGLACRGGDGEWRLPVVAVTDGASGEVRQAGTDLPPDVLAAVDAAIAGEALDAAQERQARDAGWR